MLLADPVISFLIISIISTAFGSLMIGFMLIDSRALAYRVMSIVDETSVIEKDGPFIWTQLFAFNSSEEISWKWNDLINRFLIFIIFFSKNPSEDISFSMDGNLKADI